MIDTLHAKLVDTGRRLEALGKAMQNDNTTTLQLAKLADDCGLSLQFRLVHIQENEVEE